jgi:hypothetical protein
MTRPAVPRIGSIRGLALALGALLGCSVGDGGSALLLTGRSPMNSTFARAPQRVTDGVVAVAGDAADTELTSVIEVGGGIEWDLGTKRRITHAWIAADHDDRYAVSTSDDGTRWTQVWEAPPASGGGQQRRSAAALSASARYVRLEPRGGDGVYAVSELVLAEEPPGFPPPLEEERGARRADSTRTPVLWAGVAALAIAAGSLLPASLRRKRGAGAQDPPSADRLAWITAAVCALLVITALRYAAEYDHRVLDDSYISFQYAKNWAIGNGPVFNPGERVEGYTNFLWMACMTPLWWVAGGDPERFTTWVVGLTLVLAVASLGLVAAVARLLFKDALLPAAFAVLLLGLDDSFVMYTILGLENHLLIACQLAGLWLALKKPKHWETGLGVSFACVAMTRPDGLLWMGTYFVAELAGWLPGMAAGARTPRRALARVGATFLTVWGVYFAWRFAYYGYPLPNTFYLKVGATLLAVSRGLEYVSEFVAQRYGVPLLALASVLLWRETWVRWLLLHAVLHVAYIVYVGGDFYPGHRFLLALIPTLALLCAAAFERLTRPFTTRAIPIWLPAIAVLACLLVRTGTITRGAYALEIRAWGKFVDHNVRYMQWLGGVRRPDASLVLGDIGAAGFFADVRVVDVYGVIDPVVAHRSTPGFGTGKPGHEKFATPEELLAHDPTYIKFDYIDPRLVPTDEYYLFNTFPPALRVPGLWVRDDREHGEPLREGAFTMDGPSASAWNESWTRTGTAFAAPPSARPRRGQNVIYGHAGAFVNSFSAQEGDRATGRLVSREFTLVGDRMRLLVGGGRDPERLRVALLVDGRAVFSETGSNFATLGRREWAIHELKGRTARIEIVDDATGVGGHILVDEIVQWTGGAENDGSL